VQKCLQPAVGNFRDEKLNPKKILVTAEACRQTHNPYNFVATGFPPLHETQFLHGV
jgi:hypothetical protein